MAKMMLKSSQGRVRDRGVTWFPDLVDKSKCMSTECSSVLTCTYGVCLLLWTRVSVCTQNVPLC